MPASQIARPVAALPNDYRGSNSPSGIESPATVALVTLVAILAGMLAMSPNVADPDLWGHVQYGRDVISTGAIPATTSYSFTAENFRWVNHENLSEILMALVADAWGPLGLVGGKMLLSLLVLAIVAWHNLRQRTGLIASAVLLVLLGANLGYHWSIRPQLASFVCFVLMIGILQMAFGNWSCFRLPGGRRTDGREGPDNDQPGNELNLRWLWLLPPLMWLWTNAHGGFVAGYAILSCYLGMRCVELWFRRGVHGWQPIGTICCVAVLAIAMSLLNPYGAGLHGWLLESLGKPRPEISDWATSQLFTVIGAKLWLLIAIAGFALVCSRRPRDLTQSVLLGLTLWQSLSHFRHVPFFAILTAFWLGPHLQSAIARFQQGSERDSPRWLSPAVNAALVVVCAVIGWRLVVRASDLPVMKDKFPVDAIAYMQQENLNGRLVVTYDWAQYAIAAFCVPESKPGQSPHRLVSAGLDGAVPGPASVAGSPAGTAGSSSLPGRVAFDGRFRTCYPQRVIDMHFDFLYGEDRPDGQVSRSRITCLRPRWRCWSMEVLSWYYLAGRASGRSSI